MKVLCLIDGLTLGGAERQMIGLASMLKKRNYDVDLAYYYKENFYEALVSQEGIKTSYITVNSSRFNKIYKIYKFVKKGKYDAVIAYKDGATSIACILRMLGLKFKLIVSERNTNQGVSKKDILKFALYNNADYIVPNSYSQRSFIIKNFKKLEGKTITITNFIDTDYFVPADSNNGKVKKILTVARIAKQKNIINYLYAIQNVVSNYKDVVFEWYGDIQPGEEEYANSCFEKVRDLGIEDNFKFYPAEKNIRDKYQESYIFCLPSSYEGYPNVVCEAMSCGKPILCSNVCDNPMIVQDGYTGLLFNPNDIGDISNKIETMLSLPDNDITVMGRRCVEASKNTCSKESFVEKYIQLLK